MERELRQKYWSAGEPQKKRLRWMKEWMHKWELYERILYYHYALFDAMLNEREAAKRAEKLTKLLQVQREWSSSPNSLRHKPLDAHPK